MSDRDRTDGEWALGLCARRPRLHLTGDTRDEVEREMKGAIVLHLEGLKAEGLDIPRAKRLVVLRRDPE